MQNVINNTIEEKGEFGGKCNITSCQKPNSATWFNHSTRKFYCESCAHRLNNDEFNKRDALRMFGHELCTKQNNPLTINSATVMGKHFLICGPQASGKTYMLNLLKSEFQTHFCFDEVISVEDIELNLKKANDANKHCIIATQLYYKSIPLSLLEKFTLITV